jgi:hypothetical protein
MNWKLITGSLLLNSLLLLPYNIIGCADWEDPYDYYTSFFSQALTTDEHLRPFYYTSYRFLYDDIEPVSTKDTTSAEWKSYTGSTVTETNIRSFILKYTHKQLANLYAHIEKKQALTVPDSVRNNSFSKWLIRTKDKEALGYIMYAKQVEPFVTGDENMWDEFNRDSVKMSGLIKNGIQLWTAAKNDFIKLRYGYQVMRLAHYSGRYTDCIAFYDLYVKNNKTNSVLQDLSSSLRAGALRHTGRQTEAAYEFSQLFGKTKIKRLSNFMSFQFSTRNEETGRMNINDVLAFCKTNQERASVLAMYALHGQESKLEALQSIYQTDPAHPLLNFLITREVNKLEEKYLHPSLQVAKGEKLMYSWQITGWDNDNPDYDSIYSASGQDARQLLQFCKQLASDPAIGKTGFYHIAAGYIAYMLQDLQQAKELLAAAKKESLSPKLKDQWMLTNLLVTINSRPTIDEAFEAELLPSVEWLQLKGQNDEEWKKFYRNLMKEILAVRYNKQQNRIKEALCLGNAEKIYTIPDEEDVYYGAGAAIRFVRSKLNSTETEGLYNLLLATQKSKWDIFLVKNTNVSKEDVCDAAGTAWLREHNYSKAAGWFSKIPAAYYKKEPYSSYLAANPFADLLYDTHAPTSQDTIKYTKLSFAQKMQSLEVQTTRGTSEQKAAALFAMGNAFYQMSYWGNSWMLVEYGWSGNDGLHNTHQPGTWKHEYYSVARAEQWYLKAKELTSNKNFKARCMWMAAKCAQKQNMAPKYDDYLTNYDAYEQAQILFGKTLRKNRYFETFRKENSETSVYKEVFNTCTYFSDFVQGK